MACARETIMAALCVLVNDLMAAAYGTKHVCTRDPHNPTELSPADTPHLWMIEEPESRLEDADANGYPRRSVVVAFRGVLMLTATTGNGLIRSQLNEFEAMLDQVLGLTVVGGVRVAIKPESDVESSEGEDIGVIAYRVRVTFPLTIT